MSEGGIEQRPAEKDWEPKKERTPERELLRQQEREQRRSHKRLIDELVASSRRGMKEFMGLFTKGPTNKVK